VLQEGEESSSGPEGFEFEGEESESVIIYNPLAFPYFWMEGWPSNGN